jgi:hypothetical protein
VVSIKLKFSQELSQAVIIATKQAQPKETKMLLQRAEKPH